MSPSRSHFPAFILLAVVLAGATLWFAREKPQRGPVLHADGGKWEARDLEWTEYDGYWRVSTTARLLWTRKKGIRFSKVLTGLCGAILTKRPTAPDAATRQKIYRVDINIEYPPKGSSEFKTVYPTFVPIQVRYGACNMRDDGSEYFKTYPGDLASWELSEMKASADKNNQPQLGLVFRRLNNTVELEFQPIQICEAFFADPHVYIDTMQTEQGLPENLNGLSVQVTDNKQFGGSFLNFKSGKSYDLRYVNGICQPRAEGEAT